MTSISNLIQRVLLSTTFKQTYSTQVLCYHSVSNDNWQYSINPDDFEKQLIWLKSKFDLVPLSSYVKSSPDSVNKIAITFDDGYASVFRNAFPIMKKLGVVGAIFLCDDVRQLGHDNDSKFLDKKMITTLIKAGWEVGYHSRSHEDLTTIYNDEALLRQISPADTHTANYLSKPRYFAYPFGHHNTYSERFVKENFDYGFTTDPNPNSLSNTATYGRVLIERVHSDLAIFSALLSNQGRIRYHHYSSLLKIKASLSSQQAQLSKKESTSSRIYYPPRLKDYLLNKPFYPEDPSDSYYFGIYQSKNKDYFVKFWSARKINIRYKWLQNEALFYDHYWRAFTQNITNKHKSNVVIPQYYGSDFAQRPPYLILEKITGTPISKLGLSKQLAMINDSLEFLSAIYKKLSNSYINSIPNRSPHYWLILSPVIVVGAVLRHPAEYHKILSLFLQMTRYTLQALFRSERTLVHRDINEWNILAGKNGKTILIDFQLICSADPVVEIAIIILKYYSQPGSLKKILKIPYIASLLSNSKSYAALHYYLLLFTLYDYYLNHDSTPEAIRLADDYLKGNISI